MPSKAAMGGPEVASCQSIQRSTLARAAGLLGYKRSPCRVVARYRQIVFDSQRTKPLSLIVGTRPLGFIARYSRSRLPPNGPPRSTRSYSMPSSAQHQSTFCTLDDVVRPQIFNIVAPPVGFTRIEPQLLVRRNNSLGIRVYNRANGRA